MPEDVAPVDGTLVDTSADGQLGQDSIQQSTLFETPEGPGKSVAEDDSLEFFPLSLRCRVVDQAGVTLDRPSQLGVGTPLPLRFEPDGAQHPQRVVAECVVRDEAQDSPIDVVAAAEGIEQG